MWAGEVTVGFQKRAEQPDEVLEEDPGAKRSPASVMWIHRANRSGSSGTATAMFSNRFRVRRRSCGKPFWKSAIGGYRIAERPQVGIQML